MTTSDARDSVPESHSALRGGRNSESEGGVSHRVLSREDSVAVHVFAIYIFIKFLNTIYIHFTIYKTLVAI